MPVISPVNNTRRGRPPQVEVTPADAARLRNLYMRSNRTSSDGSKILAARLAAQAGEVAPELADAIMKPRAGNALPKCITDAMHVAAPVIGRQRNAKDANLAGLYVPGCLRMVENPDGSLRRLLPGERQSWDDATINFGVCIPWPWGGDKCADRYGVRLGRFQLLTYVDDATDYCGGFDYLIRPESQAYRGEDVIAAQYRAWRNTYQPDRCMLEGGCWQCNRARVFHAAAGIAVDDATGRPHSKLVESFFNRLWTPLSLMPGNVGRWRGEQKKESEIYIACRNGRKDPRLHFPELNQALEDIGKAIHYLNTKEINSRHYGRWVPQQMHDEYLADHPRSTADAGLWYHAAPVVEERIVRRGMITLTSKSPFGESFQYHFAEENLWQFEGCRVRVYFDPWGELTATVVLCNEYRGVAAGSVLCQAVCLEDAPQVRRSAELVKVELVAAGRALDMRKAQRDAIRREHRTLAKDGKVQAQATDLRINTSTTTIETIPAKDEFETVAPVSVKRENWRESLDERLAEAERYEAEARRRGELIPV